MSIILVGMPSCGKSTLGVLLAKQLGYKFIDSDLLIQESENKLLEQIIRERGNEGFIELEGKINCKINESCAVIATGGSVIYSENAMEHFKSIGKIVYLHIGFDEMCRRLGDFSHRGIVMRGASKTLKDMYFERKPIYEKYADLVVKVENADLSDSLKVIIKTLNDQKD